MSRTPVDSSQWSFVIWQKETQLASGLYAYRSETITSHIYIYISWPSEPAKFVGWRLKPRISSKTLSAYLFPKIHNHASKWSNFLSASLSGHGHPVTKHNSILNLTSSSVTGLPHKPLGFHLESRKNRSNTSFYTSRGFNSRAVLQMYRCEVLTGKAARSPRTYDSTKDPVQALCRLQTVCRKTHGKPWFLWPTQAFEHDCSWLQFTPDKFAGFGS